MLGCLIGLVEQDLADLDSTAVELKGARTSIRVLSWQFAPLPVITGRGLFSCVPRAVPGPVARGLVPALRS
jgi:hypothetical protein